jgi:hypothetical protein
MLSKWLWTILCYVEWVGVNHGVLCWASGCESCRVMLSQWLWLWIMLCYAEPGCYESQCAMLSQWLQIIANYAERVVVNHVVLCWVGGCESCRVMLNHWLWIMVCYAEPVVVNHVLCWATGITHDSQPLDSAYHTVIHNHPAQYNTPWFTTTCSA